MKKSFIILARIAIAILVLTTVSCKKDKQVEPTNNERVGRGTSTYTPPQVEDMDAYLKDFKERIQTSNSDETFELDDAAWHLSSLANRDFGNVLVSYNDILFDTLYGHVDITNGVVELQDLGTAYDAMYNTLKAYYQNLALEGKHFRFVDAVIREDGTLTIPVIVTFAKNSRYLEDTLWYFPFVNDPFYIDSICDYYFGSGGPYYASTAAVTTLEYWLNLMVPPPTGTGTWYYTNLRMQDFYWEDYSDPFGSVFEGNSRLYASIASADYMIPPEDMCYLLDSYLDLGVSHKTAGEEIICWDVEFFRASKLLQIRNHEMWVKYGIIVQNPNPQD